MRAASLDASGSIGKGEVYERKMGKKKVGARPNPSFAFKLLSSKPIAFFISFAGRRDFSARY